MRHVICLGGSDGIHLHCTEHSLIENCIFKTGDDCIAGINIKNMTVRNCILNTSCNLFRMGGVGITVENVYLYGPGYYPHRMTVVKGKNNELPREEGRHNTLRLVDYFASTNYPYQPSEMHFKNCLFEDLKAVLYYNADKGSLQSGTHFGKLILENVKFTNLKETSKPMANEKEPLTVYMKNVSVEFDETSTDREMFTVTPDSHTTITQFQIE